MASFECPKEPPVYHTSAQQKILSKKAAYRYKFGSPKLRDLLREKCRIRMKDARRASFEGCRNTHGKLLIETILREELAELEYDIQMQDLIYNELMEEATAWSIEELEKEEDYLISAESQVVFCPICQKSKLRQKGASLVCDCGASFGCSGSLGKFHESLLKILGDHEKSCAETINFFTEPKGDKGGNVLSAICLSCNFFHNFV